MIENNKQETQQNNNSKKYNDYIKNICPPDKLIEWFTNYYGQDKKEYIESKIQNIPVIFIPSNFSNYEFSIAATNAEPNKTFGFYEKLNEGTGLVGFFNELIREDAEIPAKFIFGTNKILKELGFNPNLLFLKHKEKDVFIFAKNAEVERFKNFCKLHINKAKIDNSSLNIDSFIKIYNKIASSDHPFHTGFKIEKEGEFFNINLDTRSRETQGTYSPNQPKINTETLNEKDKQFLSDFLNFRYFSSLSKEDENYIVNGINNIFNKNYSSINDIRNDDSLKLLLDMHSYCSRKLKDLTFFKNINKEDYIPTNNAKAEEILDDEIIYFLNTGHLGTYTPANKAIQINLRSLKFSTIIHEYNHALSDAYGIYELGYCGFYDLYGSNMGFNEIVNEYLTQQVINNFSPEDKKLWQDRDSKEKCLYTPGVEFLKDFLNTYEDKLKECQLGDAKKILSDFIGIENFTALANIGSEIEDNKYSFFLQNIEWKGKIVSNVSEFIEIYKTDPEIINSLSENNQITLTYFIQANQFLEELVSNYKNFEQGKIVELNKPKPSLEIAFQFKNTSKQNTLNNNYD